MEIHQVKYFLAVARELSFTRAARACGISQPSMTRAIKMLERELGGELFVRKKTSIELTELGKLVWPYLDQLWMKAAAAEQVARDFVSPNSGQITLGIMSTIVPQRMIGLLRRFRDLNPEMRFELVDGGASELEERLLTLDIDAAIYARPGVDPSPDLDYRPLFEERMIVAVPKSHKFAGQQSVRLSELAGETQVVRSSCEFRDAAVLRRAMQYALKSGDRHACDRDEWALAMVASGHGFGIFPEWSAAREGISVIPLTDLPLRRVVNLVTVRERQPSPVLESLFKELSDFDFGHSPNSAFAIAE